ncbi:hypothetical protein [Eubacterium oxidoreducens]|uniref:Uncharacterized protein n=1 Tax=Eubacterium oxidoreducens TaxID=1732 RepID=A0A1G6A4H4_EUBOX|nr:hypothetical protein [Eubacterium oxidoreducens]SDB03156.1 hypothetical protein SAMN02910417_00236 [Eubacterium oxidoreducens]
MRKIRRGTGVIAIVLAIFIGCVAFGMTTYGYYNIENTFTHGIRAWASASSKYSSASIKIVEGSYNSGWKTGRDVTLTKIKNPIYTLKRYHRYNK